MSKNINIKKLNIQLENNEVPYPLYYGKEEYIDLSKLDYSSETMKKDKLRKIYKLDNDDEYNNFITNCIINSND